MSIEFQAVYENGLLRPEHPLPLAEGQLVRIIIGSKSDLIRQTYGIIGWKGDPEIVRRAALDPCVGEPSGP
jgi:predicted DNA-binding antitoxin AbrB/MazE fold protein